MWNKETSNEVGCNGYCETNICLFVHMYTFVTLPLNTYVWMFLHFTFLSSFSRYHVVNLKIEVS